jgi:Myb-like DNA-binding domain
MAPCAQDGPAACAEQTQQPRRLELIKESAYVGQKGKTRIKRQNTCLFPRGSRGHLKGGLDTFVTPVQKEQDMNHDSDQNQDKHLFQESRKRSSHREEAPAGSPPRNVTADVEECSTSSPKTRQGSCNPLRRRTVRWNTREVDALVAGVQQQGVGRWAYILKGSDAFNLVRTSVDLKDKWRNLTSPVRAQALRSFEAMSKNLKLEQSNDKAEVEQDFVESAETERRGSDDLTVYVSSDRTQGKSKVGSTSLLDDESQFVDNYEECESSGEAGRQFVEQDRDGQLIRAKYCDLQASEVVNPQKRRKERSDSESSGMGSVPGHVSLFSTRPRTLSALRNDSGSGTRDSDDRDLREPRALPHPNLQDRGLSFTASSVTPPFNEEEHPGASGLADGMALEHGHQDYQHPSLGATGSLQVDTGGSNEDLSYFESQYHCKSEMALRGGTPGIVNRGMHASDELAFAEASISDLM